MAKRPRPQRPLESPRDRQTALPGARRTLPPEEVQSVLKQLVSTAENYVDEELSPARVKAMKYYKGDPLGNEEEGRSQVVMTTVRDTILAVLPSLLKTFFGTDRAVEFVPSRPDTVAAAEQQSRYITHLFNRPGAIKDVMASLKDGLIKQQGFVKWWHDPVEKTTTTQQFGLTVEQVAMLEADPEVTYTVDRVVPGPPAPLHDVTVTRTSTRGKICWGAVPPEEIIYSPSARDFPDDSAVVAHRQELRAGELVAMGFPKKVVDQHTGYRRLDVNNEEATERAAENALANGGDETQDPASQYVMFYEAYARVDEDGDGIPELRRYYLMGEALEVVPAPGEEDGGYLGVPVDEIPFAYWTPDPEPHTPRGQSYADLTMDLQRIDTALIRGNLDSLGLSLHPRVAYQEGVVNPHDVLNTEIGAAIRTTGRPQDSLMEFGHSYVGKDAFPLIEHVRRVREERTGHNMESQGLNADALQSSTREGVMATLGSAAARTELVARLYAEMLVVPLFRGLYRLVKKHQNRPAMVRMFGKFVEVDPRTWDEDVEVECKLALGGGLPERKAQMFAALVDKQEKILMTLGAANPVVRLDQYTAALIKAAEYAGIPDAESYVTRITKEQAEQQAQQAAAQPPQKDPATMLAESQIQQGEAQLRLQEQKMQLDVAKFQFEQELKLQQMRQEFALKTQELEMKYQQNVNEAALQQFIQRNKLEMEAFQKTQEANTKAALELHKIEVNAALKEREIKAKQTTKKSIKLERDPKTGKVSQLVSEESPTSEE